MRHTILLLITFATILSSCKSGPPEGPIKLDEGEKWKINEEMIPHLRASEKLVAEFTMSIEKDYQSLAKQLELNNTALIKSCNMKGKRHDELHKWLHPYMMSIKKLGSTDDEAEARDIIESLEASFVTFNEHFE